MTVYVPPRFESVVTSDNGIRSDSSYEALAALKPVFDRRYGSVTAGHLLRSRTAERVSFS